MLDQVSVVPDKPEFDSIHKVIVKLSHVSCYSNFKIKLKIGLFLHMKFSNTCRHIFDFFHLLPGDGFACNSMMDTI